MVAGATTGNQGQKVTHFQSSKNINLLLWVYDLKMWLKLQILYYHQLNQWLLGATTGSQGQKVTHFQSSKIINHLLWVYDLKIWLKL